MAARLHRHKPLTVGTAGGESLPASKPSGAA
jgi:hypothetical protein